MNQNYIQFKQQRGLENVLNDTFKFLRQNLKPLFSIIFKIAGPALLLLALATGFYSYTSLSSAEFSVTEVNIFENYGQVFISFAVFAIASLLYTATLYSTVLHYIKSYIENNGEVVIKDITNGVRQDFGSMLGLNFLVGIMLIFGFLLCFIPGIYLSVPLGITFSILIFDRKSIIDSIYEGFHLVKDNWWITFATFLVIVILVYVISMVFSLPLLIYTFVQSFTIAREGSSANPYEIFDTLYIILNTLSSIAQYLLYTITIIATAFIYFNLKEKKYFTGTYETIDNLGKEKN